MALSLSEIKTRCASFQVGYYPYYPELKEYFRLLELSGCRTTEPLDFQRWTYVSDSTLLLQPLKGNNQRVINVGNECQSFVNDIRLRRNPFKGRTLANVYSCFNQIRTFRNSKVNSKPVSVYLFRYAYIKSLFDSGQSVMQVAAHMGYTSVDTPTYYLTAQLYDDVADSPTNFVLINGLWWSNENIKIDTGHSGIFKRTPIDAEKFGYLYTRPAALDVVSKMGGCRLPTYADFQQLSNFIVTSGEHCGAIRNPYSGYWSFPSSINSNLFSFDARGGGYYDGFRTLEIGTHASILFHPVVGRLYCFYLYSNRDQFNYATYRRNVSVRLILSDPVLP